MLRLVFILLGSTAAALLAPARPVDPPPPRPASVPPIVQSVAFDVREDGESRKVVVTAIPSRWRFDAPTDGYSIIYDPKTQFYIGLENRNYTYWDFSWPGVRAAVQNTKRYESRLRELGADSLNGSASDLTPAPDVPPSLTADTNASNNAPPSFNSMPPTAAPPVTTTASAGSDDSGYVWKPTEEHTRINGLDCIKWTGESVSNEPATAWCYAGPIVQVQEAYDQLKTVNEPIALVPVRNLVPDFIFAVNESLSRGGVTPLKIVWGDGSNQNYFVLTGIRNRTGSVSLYSVPREYMKTTLITMDGIGDQKPPGVYEPIHPPKERASAHLP
jgi:hypothetical protein